MAVHYDALAQNPSDIEDDGREFEFKHARSYSSYPFAVFRKTRRVLRTLYILIPLIIVLLVLQVTFNTSYLHPPPFLASPDESVYIAANIVDGALIDGAWGQSILDLVELIGKDRVFVSIYGGPEDALKRLGDKLPCENSLVSEEREPIDVDGMPHVTLHTGKRVVKRIAFLAEVRNRALRSLDTLPKKYDRILFLNDIFFDAKDAVRLLWGTNFNEHTGKAEYKAACGADFITSWKYYDTFATRDIEGNALGVPFFPWFSTEGDAQSRQDVVDESSAVRVKSCWGGIVAFDGRYFQNHGTPRRDDALAEGGEGKGVTPVQLPMRFRSVAETFWDASECCLVHADLIDVEPLTNLTWGLGIYMNPYVRVSYDATTQSRLWITKHFERLFGPVQRIINFFAQIPTFNSRRTEVGGQVYKERIWASNNASNLQGESGTALHEDSPQRSHARDISSQDYWHTEGHYIDHERTADRGGYCGSRKLLALKEGSWEDGNWYRFDGAMPPLEIDF